MRAFSGTYLVHSPEAITANRIQPEQTNAHAHPEKDECDPGRAGMNIQPYRTEFRNLYKQT